MEKSKISSIFVPRNKIIYIPRTSESELSVETVKYGADDFSQFLQRGKGADEPNREGIHILSLNSSHLTIIDITRYTKSKVPFLEKRSRSFVDHDWQ